MNRLVSAAFAPTTQAAYKQGIQAFNHFRAAHGLVEDWPVSSQQVIQFAAHLSLQGRAHTTVRTYLAGIGTKHKLHGWKDPTDNFLLKKLLQGMTKLDSRQDKRKPVTYQMLKSLISALPSICDNVYEQKLFAAAFTLAFFGFLRVSEIVGQGKSVAGGRAGLSLAAVQLGEKLRVNIAGSKADQTNKGASVCLRRVVKHPDVCPVLAMQSFLQARHDREGLLFQHYNGSPLTRYQFQAVLKKGARVLGWEVNKYTSHSFRIGAATTAAINGTPMDRIMRLGRWSSMSAKKYVRPSQV